ncbi:inorganic pyrophosphatase 2-like [Trifolium pratense]|uniref:Inorganic pyrophosphatase 2-like n=1 Tax=Trifolium pratense TaxID=57577 RepID=A0A2K3LGI0_TRIPR|nr:inorganic pyrophosphatase 2-like [Trifolium pratense]
MQGLVMERLQNSLEDEGKKKIIYLGDGNGDFCPSLKLKESDYLMPRMNFALSDLVSKNSNDIKANVHDWMDGEELENVLLHIINKANNIGKENNIVGPKIISNDCKLGTVSIDAHKIFPEAIAVPL